MSEKNSVIYFAKFVLFDIIGNALLSKFGTIKV